MGKIFKGIYNALVVGLMAMGLAYDLGNFKAMLPAILALVIIAAAFQIFSLKKVPKK